jgi:PAS domain S-box-containing protein
MQQMSAMTDPNFANPMLEALGDGFCALDPEWRITYWNGAAERMLRVPRTTVLGRTVWAAFPQLQNSASWTELQRVSREGTPRRYLEANPVHRDRGCAEVHAAPLGDGGLAVQFRDVTEDLQQEKQSAALLESIHDGFIAVDAHWRIVFLNAVAESLLRLPRSRAMGALIWPLLPARPPEIAECLRATLADGIQRHLRDVRPEGRVFRGRVFDLWTHPLVGGGISALIEDVSERAQREQELARLAAEAEEANQSKGRFFAAISHELRTPLNAIVGYTHLLATGTYGEMPEGAHRAADRAGVCAEHLARLVDDVLLLTTTEIRRVPIIPVTLDVHEYLPGVIEPLRHQAAAKGLDFDVHIPRDLPLLETDPQRLRQLLVAMLSNAVKFTDQGSIRLDISLQPALFHSDSGYDLFPQQQIEFAVTDTGPGVAKEDQERIFGAFEQLGDPSRSHSMTQGTGLGLTIARQLSEMLHGTLYLAESSPAGSRFCLRLPVEFGERGS